MNLFIVAILSVFLCGCKLISHQSAINNTHRNRDKKQNIKDQVWRDTRCLSNEIISFRLHDSDQKIENLTKEQEALLLRMILAALDDHLNNDTWNFYTKNIYSLDSNEYDKKFIFESSKEAPHTLTILGSRAIVYWDNDQISNRLKYNKDTIFIQTSGNIVIYFTINKFSNLIESFLPVNRADHKID